MSGWYLAPALVVLRAEIDTRWPHRDRTSDGSIGDAAHQATASDHNPNSRGSVDAIDVDKDGIDPYVVLAAVQRHPSAHYWIYRRQIADRDDGWRRRPYSGPNPHDKHLHVSIRQTRTAEQDRRPWGLLEDDMSEKAEREIHSVFTGMFYGGSSMGRQVDADGPGPAEPANSLVAKLDYLMLRVDALTAQVTALSGRDFTDEPAIVAGVLAGLPAEQIAAAIPTTVARDVADELARRMVS